jgi:hypothetical protein
MTIICVDKHSVAADGLSVFGGIVTSRTTKKIKVVKGTIYVLYGTTQFFGPAIAWHQAGANPADIPKGDKENDWHLVVVDQRGVVQYNWDTPYADPVQQPWAFGANWEVALGLMLAGKTAKEAVEFMCDKSMYAGGEVQVVNIAEAIGQLREAAE